MRQFRVHATTSKDKFVEGDSLELYCNFTKVDPSVIKQIEWIFSNSPIDSEDVQISSDGSILSIPILNHTKHNGSYFCKVYLMSGISVTSEENIILLIECK